VTPHVEVVAEGSEGAALFESLLIDDPDPEEEGQDAGAGGDAGGGNRGDGSSMGRPPAQLGGRAGFEQHVRAEVALQLQG
jgi:hypothetical protein